MPRSTIPFATILLLALLPAAVTDAGDERPGWAHPDVTGPPLALPRARATSEPAHAPVFLVNVDARGDVLYADGQRLAATAPGKRAPLTKAKLSVEDEAQNLQTLRKLARAMEQAAARAGPRDADGSSRMRLLIRASRDLPWVEVLWIVTKGAASGARLARILFAVDGPGWPVLGYDLPREQPGAALAADRRRVRLELGPTPASDKTATLQLADPTPPVTAPPAVQIDLTAPNPTGYLEHALDGFAQLGGDLVVEIALAPSGHRSITLGDVLPLLATAQAAGHAVQLAAAPLGRVADLEGNVKPSLLPPLRGPFLTRLPRRPPPQREERRHVAIQRALDWLVAHQSRSGGWEAEHPDLDEAGRAVFDRGVTGLALLAFLGDGHTHRGDSPYAKAVEKGLQHLKARQDAEGCFSPREPGQYVYNHATATWAMVEAYGLTRSPALLDSAQKGLDFICLARNPYFAWRYGIKPGDNDTSVTAWMLMPLAAARILNEDAKARGQVLPLRIDEEAFDGARAWLDKLTDRDYGRTGYIQRGGSPARPQELIDRFPGDKSESMTAAAITLRAFSGTDVTRNPLSRKGVKLLTGLPPRWRTTDGSLDMYYWFWGTMAMHQVGGQAWKRWWEAVDEAIVPNQRKDTTRALYRGSWDPLGPWGRDGGRVYSTSLCCLILETPRRYDRYGDRRR